MITQAEAFFETRDPSRAMEYIRIHLEEGYQVTAIAKKEFGYAFMQEFAIHVIKEENENTSTMP